jgi:hypothetical protein
MKIKTVWAIQSLFLCFLFNLAFAAVIFFMADRTMEALNEWVSPLTGSDVPALPDDLHMALGSFGNFIAQVRGYLTAVLAALASAFTLLLWFFLFLAGGRQIRKAGEWAGLSRVVNPKQVNPIEIEKPEGSKKEGEEAR